MVKVRVFLGTRVQAPAQLTPQHLVPILSISAANRKLARKRRSLLLLPIRRHPFPPFGIGRFWRGARFPGL